MRDQGALLKADNPPDGCWQVYLTQNMSWADDMLAKAEDKFQDVTRYNSLSLIVAWR